MEIKWISISESMPECFKELLWPKEFDTILKGEWKELRHKHPNTHKVLTIDEKGEMCLNQRICTPRTEKKIRYYWKTNNNPIAWMPIPKYKKP